MAEAKAINVGIIGAARVATYAMIAPAREVPGVNVHAVAARDLARAQGYAATHGIPLVHETYDALIGDAAVDLVYVATPPVFHAETAIKALRAGKHVLVEKPFAMNAAEARAVLDVAAQEGGRVFEAFHYRHHALWGRILELLRGGAIGRIVSLEATFDAPISRGADEFRWDKALGGGALMDLGCYPLQWVRVATGEEPIVQSASMRMIDGVDAVSAAVLRFPSGAVANISCRMDGEGFRAQLAVTGERGALTVVNPLAPQMGHRLEISAGGEARSETVAGASTFAAQLRAIVATLRDGAPFPLANDDPVKSMGVIDAVRARASA